MPPKSKFTGLISILPLPVEAGDLQGDLKAELDTQITGKVVFEVGICADSIRFNRSLGEDRYCRDLEPLGALTIGLYGRLVPITVDNFIKTVDAGAYNGTVFNKVRPGEYVSAGKQGTARNGEVEAPSSLQSNPELTSSKSFRLTHTRPGTVSLALAENEDSANVTLSKTYHPTQFLVTTGPGPAPRLNNGNVVFGRVLDGFDVLAKIAEVKTFTPAARVQAFNTLAKALGDERAEEARKSWGRPIQPVVIISNTRQGGRKLNFLSSSVQFRSNNQAFSASVDATPSYLARALGSNRRGEKGGFAAAVAYGVDVRPSNFLTYLTGAPSRNAESPLGLVNAFTKTEADVENVDGQQRGKAYAEAHGNLASYSRAYLHLFDEDSGEDFEASSEVEANALSEKGRDEVFQYSDRVKKTLAEVEGFADAYVSSNEAAAEQHALARTDDHEEGHTKCSETKLLGQVTKDGSLSSNESLQRRFRLLSRC
eukprot:g31.t1